VPNNVFDGGCSSKVEYWIVIPGVVGSSPISHPIFSCCFAVTR
jgi:hypothetical protein